VADTSTDARAAVRSAVTSVRPANEASWAELRAVFGERGEPARCQCQWFRSIPADWRAVPVSERTERHREQTGCDDPAAGETSGLVAYLDDEPVGWCAVAPRSTYPRLLTSRVVWSGRTEDPDDDSVWAVTCFVTRAGFRRRGVSAALVAAAVAHARDHGARAIEGYPIVPVPGKEYSWGELYVGSRNSFADAGFVEVTRPTVRRAVMRVDFPVENL
jgi:GNAT superfamily N-acetyltransferase